MREIEEIDEIFDQTQVPRKRSKRARLGKERGYVLYFLAECIEHAADRQDLDSVRKWAACVKHIIEVYGCLAE